MDTSGGRAVSIESHESWSEEGEIEASLDSKEICKSMLSAGHLVAIDLDPEPSPGDNEQVERSRMDIEVGEEDSSFRYSISSMETQSSLDTSSELIEHSNELEEVSTEPFHIVGSTGAISHVKSRSNPKRKLPTNGQVTEDVADEGGKDVVEIASAPAGRMGKVELEEYANDPSLVRIRWCLFILCCFVWLAMLIAAIAIIVSAPKYRVPAPLEYCISRGRGVRTSISTAPMSDKR